jgi:hypothetical protein
MKRFLEFLNEIKSPEQKRAREKHDQEKLELRRRHANEILRAQEKDIDASKREQEKKMRQRASVAEEQIEQVDKEPPPEIGTDDIVRRYKKFIPNQ